MYLPLSNVDLSACLGSGIPRSSTMSGFQSLVILAVLQSLNGFNIEPAAWRSFRNSAEGFGHKVIQKTKGLLVSAPLQQYSQSGRGQIYECFPSTSNCSQLQLPLPPYAVNTSLGLSMAFNPSDQKSLVCGPTIPKDCSSITMYNGLCLELDQNNTVTRTTPSTTADCPSQPADIAFLLDGSGSVHPKDFTKMKDFVVKVIQAFIGKDSRFAIVQFSHVNSISYYFNTFRVSGSWRDEIFQPNRGNRPKSNNVLIVITDGESTDGQNLPAARDAANRKNIIRFAIGVGNAFNNPSAKTELQTIASSKDHVFQVEGFDALDKISQTLQEKIFSIEGTQSGGETLKMEMSQLGFGAAFSSEGFQMTAVGANEWRGGLKKFSRSGSPVSFYEPLDIDKDSYLGYSIAVANTVAGTFTAVGAPRYRHRGIVMYVYSTYTRQWIDPLDWEFQSGEYFGAEVCTMDVNGDRFTDVLLISAPMFVEKDREGRVYVCDVTDWNVECHFDAPVVLRGAPDKGRFGSSLAVLPDLNADNLADLAVGAPLENDGRGSIYIYHGSGFGRINTTFSQRIAASEVESGLKYFGTSISPTSLDQSGDGLPDLLVGSKGTVVLLRSKPIVKVDATISFTPALIPTQNPDCSKPIAATADICFFMSKVTALMQAQARINYTFSLDATRAVPNNRAFISDNKEQDQTGSITISLNRRECVLIPFSIQSCPEDALNPLYNEMRYTFESLPMGQTLTPSLSQQSPTTHSKDLGFEINCGVDETCTDSLIVDFNFTSSSLVRVGIDKLLDVTVSLENTEENSYDSRVILTYPSGLSYRKFTGLQGRIDCSSKDSENGLTRGRTDCFIDKPIFKSNAKAFFVVSYGFTANSQLDRSIYVTANATSANVKSSPSSKLYRRKEIGVKYSISMTIGSSPSYTNFTFGQNDLQKPVNQSIKVTNEIRALNFSVVIRVPVALGQKNIWANSSFQIADCQKEQDEEPTIPDFLSQVQENKIVNCSVARCSVFRCTRFMGRMESKDYVISANLSSAWIQQIGLKSVKFLLISTAALEYDTDRFVFYSAEIKDTKIEAEVEVYTEVDFTKEIVGGSVGAVLLVLLLTAALYKAGFFKSKYQKMMAEEAMTQENTGASEEPQA
uniref:VWFA domain-containing protein n=1 Tax=Knipowitschia caucasica TaxID=637954 RepID=A0AAV2LIE3_KNICA